MIDVAIWMLAFGAFAGLVFPFFVMLLGVPRETALNPLFIMATLCAGISVGGMNYMTTRWIFCPRRHSLTEKINEVADQIHQATYSGEWKVYVKGEGAIPVDSQDEIGANATAFNKLFDAFMESRNVKLAVDSFAHSLSSTLDLTELAERALAQLLDRSDAQAGAVIVEASGDLEVAASMGIKNTHSLLDNDHVRYVFRSGNESRIALPDYLIVDGVLADFRPRKSPSFRSALTTYLLPPSSSSRLPDSARPHS